MAKWGGWVALVAGVLSAIELLVGVGAWLAWVGALGAIVGGIGALSK